MKAPITTFNLWVLTKINHYLSASEGCMVEKVNYTSEGAKTIVRDAFGFRYEIDIKTLGRVQHDESSDNFSRLHTDSFGLGMENEEGEGDRHVYR